MVNEDMLNMSLDELIKLKRKESKTLEQNNQKTNKTKTKPRRGRKPKSPAKVKNENSMVTTSIASSVKVAKVVGAGKAKRAAQMDKLRGLNPTGKPSKMEVVQAVNKQLSQMKKPILTNGLKISFKPGELNKTTDKAVSEQIKAVLSKTPRPRMKVKGPASLGITTPRTVVIPTKGNTKKSPGGPGKLITRIIK